MAWLMQRKRPTKRDLPSNNKAGAWHTCSKGGREWGSAIGSGHTHALSVSSGHCLPVSAGVCTDTVCLSTVPGVHGVPVTRKVNSTAIEPAAPLRSSIARCAHLQWGKPYSIPHS
eukprot:1160161-Pelagomonas_calceolata.AAC.3